VWVFRSGVALMVTPRIDAFADSEDEVGDDSGLAAIGACRADDGITFPGALRAAAASLIDSKQRRTDRAGSGVEVARE
jgi:hypothetical protein